jgi:hypothetical protein
MSQTFTHLFMNMSEVLYLLLSSHSPNLVIILTFSIESATHFKTRNAIPDKSNEDENRVYVQQYFEIQNLYSRRMQF